MAKIINNASEIHRTMNDVIDIAYPDTPDEQKRRFKLFSLEIKTDGKQSRAAHGKYYPTEHRIVINNANREDAYLLVTILHEMSHHIETITTGSTGHQSSFYAIFQKLLYAALDMELFNRDDYVKEEAHASDAGKVATMLSYYRKQTITYKQNIVRVIVKNGYDKKEILKERGYQFASFSKAWVKDIDKDEEEAETKFLSELNVEYDIADPKNIVFAHPCYIETKYIPEEYRPALKEMGFYWSKIQKKWRCLNESEKERTEKMRTLKKEYPGIQFLNSKL